MACRVFGISRTRYYERKGVAERYGPVAVMPKGAADTSDAGGNTAHAIEALLTLTVTQPTMRSVTSASRLARPTTTPCASRIYEVPTWTSHPAPPQTVKV